MTTTFTSTPLPAGPPAAAPESSYPMEWTIADLQARLGGIPMERIRLYPLPSRLATESDVLEIHARTGRLCELVDGVLVEKPMGFYESALAVAIAELLRAHVKRHRLGIVGGADACSRSSAA